MSRRMLSGKGYTHGATLDAATIAWVSQVVTNGGSVSSGRQTIIDTMIKALKPSGAWGRGDRLWFTAAENTQSALTDMIGLTLATVPVSPTFTVDQGYKGNGSSQYIDTGFNPSTGTPNFTQNNAAYLLWSNSTTGNGGCDLGYKNTGGHVYLYAASLFAKLNDGANTVNVANSNPNGLWSAYKPDFQSTTIYHNGSSFGSATGNTSAAIPNENLAILVGDNVQYSNEIILAAGFGAWTASDMPILYSAIHTALQAISGIS